MKLKSLHKWKLVEKCKEHFGNELETWDLQIFNNFSFKLIWTYSEFDNFPLSENELKVTENFFFFTNTTFAATNTTEVFFLFAS